MLPIIVDNTDPDPPDPPEPPPPGPPEPQYDTTIICYLTMNGKHLAKIVRKGTNPAETFFLHTDLVGSIRAITDSTSQVVAMFDYEPFGLTTQASGALAGETHKFTGKPEDGTGLYYFGARYCDPRWEGSRVWIRRARDQTGMCTTSTGISVNNMEICTLKQRRKYICGMNY